MKKFLILLAFLAFSASLLLSQTVNEKKIVSFPQLNNVEAYSFKFDNKSGTYFYTSYDTATQKSTIYSNKGNSKPYNSVMDYTGIISDDGNYFVITSDNIDTVYTYYVIKNGEEIASYPYIDANWVLKNGMLYYMCKDKDDKYYFVMYNTADGSVNKSKAYDDITLVYFPYKPSEGEPVGTVGFTGSGEPYYIALLNNQRFVVIGTAEQKHYSDIDTYNFTLDKNGELTYFAKDKGKFYEIRGDAFVVQGTKEYKRFDYVYAPIIFDNSNTPVYIAGDSSGGDLYPQRVVVGDNEGKNYTGGLFDIRFTPSGKMAYTASNTINADNGSYESYLVIDGKESKKYSYISNLNFLPDGTPFYAAGKSKNKSVIVKGSQENPVELPEILELKILPDGEIAYIQAKYGDYEKKQKDKYIVTIGDEQFGPFDGMQNFYNADGSYILTDAAGGYAFIATKVLDYNTYKTESTIYYKDGTGKKSDYFDYVYLYKGKPVYTSSKLTDKINNIYTYKLYYGNKAVGPDYNSISNFNFDVSTGTASFTGVKGKDLYSVEVKF